MPPTPPFLLLKIFVEYDNLVCIFSGYVRWAGAKLLKNIVSRFGGYRFERKKQLKNQTDNRAQV